MAASADGRRRELEVIKRSMGWLDARAHPSARAAQTAKRCLTVCWSPWRDCGTRLAWARGWGRSGRLAPITAPQVLGRDNAVRGSRARTPHPPPCGRTSGARAVSTARGGPCRVNTALGFRLRAASREGARGLRACGPPLPLKIDRPRHRALGADDGRCMSNLSCAPRRAGQPACTSRHAWRVAPT